MDAATTLHIELDAFDLEDLKSSIDSSLIKVESAKPDEAFGEPLTIAVIVLAPLAIQALTAWLTKQRRRQEIVFDTEVEEPDGSRRKETLRIRMNSSTTEQQVLRQLIDALKLNPDLIKAVASLGE